LHQNLCERDRRVRVDEDSDELRKYLAQNWRAKLTALLTANRLGDGTSVVATAPKRSMMTQA
jgi:hypothetical protein